MIESEDIGNATAPTPDPFYGLNNWSAGSDPGAGDDSADGYSAGSFWFNVAAPTRFYVCTDATEGAAVWREIAVERFGFATTAFAAEDLSAGNLVNLYNDSGTLKARKADASSPSKPANGFVTLAASSGGSAIVYFRPGSVITGLSGLTVAADLFLSGSTPGGMTGTAPSTSGYIVQRVGKALTSTTAIFDPGQPLELA